MLAVLVVVAVGGAVLAEASLRVPRRVSPRPALTGAQEVQLAAADGAVLRGSFVRGSGQNCVMVLHGIADSRNSAMGFQPGLARAGYSVLAPDSRAHGESGGDFVTYGVLEQDDVRRWAAWLKQERGCTRVLGLGESLGGASLIMAAAAQPPPFDAVVAECAYSDLRSIAAHRVGLYTGLPHALRPIVAPPLVASAILYTRVRYGLDLRNASPVEAARHLQTPLLLIHGLRDNLTPPAHSRQIFAASPSGAAQLWEVPDAGHTTASGVAGAEFWTKILGHFDAHAFPGVK